MVPLFVYGSLKKGFYNSQLLNTSKYLGKAVTVGSSYKMYSNGNFPYVVPDDSGEGDTIKGELYLVDSRTLQTLDALEGHPNNYERQEVIIEAQGEKIRAYMYIYKHVENLKKNPVIKEVPGGEFFFSPKEISRHFNEALFVSTQFFKQKLVAAIYSGLKIRKIIPGPISNYVSFTHPSWNKDMAIIIDQFGSWKEIEMFREHHQGTFPRRKGKVILDIKDNRFCLIVSDQSTPQETHRFMAEFMQLYDFFSLDQYFDTKASNLFVLDEIFSNYGWQVENVPLRKKIQQECKEFLVIDNDITQANDMTQGQ